MATKKITVRDLKELPKGKAGNPNLVEWVPTAKEIEAAKMMAAIDFTEAAIAGVLRVSTNLFLEAKAKYPELASALKTAKKDVEWGLYKQIADFVRDPDVPYERKRKDIAFLLARKHGWRETSADNSDKQMLPGTISFEQVDVIAKEAEPD